MIQLTPLKKPPPIKCRWGLWGDAGDNTIPGSKCLGSALMYGGSRNVYGRSSDLRGKSLCAIDLYVHLSIYH